MTKQQLKIDIPHLLLRKGAQENIDSRIRLWLFIEILWMALEQLIRGCEVHTLALPSFCMKQPGAALPWTSYYVTLWTASDPLSRPERRQNLKKKGKERPLRGRTKWKEMDDYGDQASYSMNGCQE